MQLLAQLLPSLMEFGRSLTVGQSSHFQFVDEQINKRARLGAFEVVKGFGLPRGVYLVEAQADQLFVNPQLVAEKGAAEFIHTNLAANLFDERDRFDILFVRPLNFSLRQKEIAQKFVSLVP